MESERGLEETLGRVSLRVTSSLELDHVLGEITRGLVRDLEAAMARVWLLGSDQDEDDDEDDAGTLQLAASAGLS